MSPFTHVLVLASIVIGMGMREVLIGFVDTVRARQAVRLYWPHLLFASGVFATQMTWWWIAWSYRGHEWTVGALLLLISGPVLLFMIARLTFPNPVVDQDLEAYYYGLAPILLVLAFLYTGRGLASDVVFLDRTLASPTSAVRAFAMVLIMVMALTKRRWVHHWGQPLLWTSLTGVVLLFYRSLGVE